MLDEHRVDGLQVEFGRHVHDGEIFIVELAMPFGRIAVILDQMHEEVLLRDHVTVEIHRHEARQLQKARIDRAGEARQRPRHLHDDIVLEPFDRLVLRQFVDAGRIDARVDRAAHQRHARWREGIAAFFHHRDGGQDRNRRLADREHMGVGTKRMQHRDHVVDIIVEIETAFGDGTMRASVQSVM
jgi:hypothetical protein